MKALVLDSGNSSSYHAMRSLAVSGHEVHLLAGGYCHWLKSRYCARGVLWPPEESEGWSCEQIAGFLLKLVRAEGYGMLLSCGDTLTESIYAHHDELAEHVDCAMPHPSRGAIVLKKSRASEFAASLGVPVPRTFLVDYSAVIAEELPYPVVVKGQTGSGSSSVRFSLDAEEFKRDYLEISELESALGVKPTVQEYVGGDGYLVHLLYWHGQPYAAVCHRKDREFPIGGGVTAAATTVHEPELLNSAMRIARGLEWHGLVKMDFVRDPVTREFKFVEVDPRVSASIDIARVAGTDQVAMLADLVAGKEVRPNLNFVAGIRYRWLFPRDVMACAAAPLGYLALLPDLLSRRVHFDLGFDDWRPLCWQLGRLLQEGKFLDRRIRVQARAARRVHAAYEARIAVRKTGAPSQD